MRASCEDLKSRYNTKFKKYQEIHLHIQSEGSFFIMKLYDHQKEDIENIKEQIRNGKRRIILVKPCGGGKTVIAKHIIKKSVEKGNKVAFLVHRKELIEQASKHFDDIKIPHGIIKSGHWRDLPFEPVQICSPETLKNRTHFEANLVFVDECHRSIAPETLKLLNERYSESTIIGLTATPYRLDGRGLGEFYDSIVRTTTEKDLIEAGFLMDPAIYMVENRKSASVKIVKTDTGEETKEADFLLRGRIVQTWLEHCKDMSTVVYARNIKHSKLICKKFNENGIKAYHIDSKIADKKRNKILDNFNKNKFKVLCNVEILTEGWDKKDLECVAIARDTESRSLWKQIVGRAARVHPNKTKSIILDFVGLTRKHGYIDDEEIISLDTEEKVSRKKSKSNKIEDCISICFNCDPARYVKPGLRICPECKNPLKPEDIIYGETEEKLVEVDKKIKRFSMEDKQKKFDELCEICMRKKYNPKWVLHHYKTEFGVWPKKIVISKEWAEYKDTNTPRKITPNYKKYRTPQPSQLDLLPL